jgi:quercetin dioxygenase-like cupin family protein
MEKFSINNYIVKPENKIAKRVIYKNDNVLAFILNIAPDESLPDHTHFDSTLLIQILKGKAVINADEKKKEVTKGDLTRVEGQEVLSIDNVGNDILELYVTISPNPPADKYSTDADI